jgi:hypothetical protein
VSARASRHRCGDGAPLAAEVEYGRVVTDDDPEQVRPAQEWVARQAQRAAWTMIVLGGVAFIAGVVRIGRSAFEARDRD